MDWEQTTAIKTLTEWTRADGNATIRLRRRSDGSFAVRYDQLYQAPDGRAYAYETTESRDEAERLVANWQSELPV